MILGVRSAVVTTSLVRVWTGASHETAWVKERKHVNHIMEMLSDREAIGIGSALDDYRRGAYSSKINRKEDRNGDEDAHRIELQRQHHREGSS